MRIVEAGLWLMVIVCVSGGRDAWRANDWSMFLVASCVGGVFAAHLRKHLQSTSEAP